MQNITLEQAQTMPLESSWLEWARPIVEGLKHQGYVSMPLVGIVWQVDQEKKIITIVAEIPEYTDSTIDILNRRVFGHFGYNFVKPDDVLTSHKEVMDKFGLGRTPAEKLN